MFTPQNPQQRADSRQIGVELGIRYVVTGSARSSGDRVRINVQLVEAESGNQLWAGRYDVSRGNTLDLQDEIARRIIVELEPALTKADLSGVKRRRIESVDAWSHFRQAAGAIAGPRHHHQSRLARLLSRPVCEVWFELRYAPELSGCVVPPVVPAPPKLCR